MKNAITRKRAILIGVVLLVLLGPAGYLSSQMTVTACEDEVSQFSDAQWSEHRSQRGWIKEPSLKVPYLVSIEYSRTTGARVRTYLCLFGAPFVVSDAPS